MMSFKKEFCGDHAEKIFWETVELVVLVFSDMDMTSTKHLATIHKMTRKILENPLTWKNIARIANAVQVTTRS